MQLTRQLARINRAAEFNSSFATSICKDSQLAIHTSRGDNAADLHIGDTQSSSGAFRGPIGFTILSRSNTTVKWRCILDNSRSPPQAGDEAFMRIDNCL